MSQVSKSMARAAGAAVVLAAFALTATPAMAADQAVVVKDAESGKLRNATAAEHAALAAKEKKDKARIAPGQMMPKFHASGAKGTRLTDEFMSTSVVVRQADGTLVRQCVEGHDEAQHAAHTTAQPVTE